MGRRKKEAAKMGKALIKDRFHKKTSARGGESFLHTTELDEGRPSINLTSMTEQTSMADFLLTAELAGRDFTAEKGNVQLVTPQLSSGVLSGERLKKVKEMQDLHRHLLRIPRRPPWQESTPADKLRQDEHLSFLDWRRQLARLQEEDGIVITPYEKNLEFWRQLWRVIERSDVVVQIVDARNPLLFWCPDVDRYVREVDPRKHTLLLINKADLLTVTQRQAWAEYFASQGVHVVFWSAVEEAARLDQEKSSMVDFQDELDEEDLDSVHSHSSHDDERNGDEDDLVEDSRSENTEDKGDHVLVESGGDKRESGSDKRESGSDKCESGSDKRESGGDKRESGGDKRESGGDKRESGGDKRESGGDKRESGGDKRESGGDKRESGSDKRENDSDCAAEDPVTTCNEESEQKNMQCDDDDGDKDDNSNEYDSEEDYEDDENEWESVDSDEEEEEDSGKRRELCEPEDSTTASSERVAQKEDIHSPQPVAVADSRLQTSEELLALFRQTGEVNYLAGVVTVGMVGYPNVGKSSTINTILRTKKVAVSATPGRTKHFQTLYVERDLMLCDCPGLVFPSFVTSKAELVVSGILPIDQLHDSQPPVELVCQRVGRSALESVYHLNLPPPGEDDNPEKAPSAYDLLQAYGALRGFMSHKGNPDRPRAARYILKDFVNGKLLYCHPPPGIDGAAFQKPPYGNPELVKKVPRNRNQKTEDEKKTEAIDREYESRNQRKAAAQPQGKAHAQGPHGVSDYVRTERLRPVGAGQGDMSSQSSSPHTSQLSIAGKPWKRHNNRNKKEKLRRVYKELDQH